MKITKKILENIIKEEVAKVLKRKPITEAGMFAPLIPYIVSGAKAAGVALGAEVVFSRVASALGLDQDDGKAFEAYLDIREDAMYEYITRQTNRSLKKANRIIANQNTSIQKLKDRLYILEARLDEQLPEPEKNPAPGSEASSKFAATVTPFK